MGLKNIFCVEYVFIWLDEKGMKKRGQTSHHERLNEFKSMPNQQSS